MRGGRRIERAAVRRERRHDVGLRRRQRTRTVRAVMSSGRSAGMSTTDSHDEKNQPHETNGGKTGKTYCMRLFSSAIRRKSRQCESGVWEGYCLSALVAFWSSLFSGMRVWTMPGLVRHAQNCGTGEELAAKRCAKTSSPNSLGS